VQSGVNFFILRKSTVLGPGCRESSETSHVGKHDSREGAEEGADLHLHDAAFELRRAADSFTHPSWVRYVLPDEINCPLEAILINKSL